MVWRKPDSGPCSDLVWAPEIHHNMGAWYVYFAAAPSREIKDGLFQHRMYAISARTDNPLEGDWTFEGRIDSGGMTGFTPRPRTGLSVARVGARRILWESAPA